jgi:hypothetical protein
MIKDRIVLLLTACLVLLAGIALALYFELNRSQASIENLKAEILTDLRGEVGDSSPENRAGDGQPEKHGSLGSTAERHTPAEGGVAAKSRKKPLSKVAYWISNDYSDDKLYGFATWAELTGNGHFIIEQCFAPDYSVEVTAEQPPSQTIRCKTLADARVNTISTSEILLNNGEVVPIHLAGSTQAPTLSLTLADQKIELVPGHKDNLANGLSSLTSVQNAQKLALKKYRSQMSSKTTQ